MSQDFSPEKLIANITTNLLDPANKYLLLQTKITQLKELQTEMKACDFESPKHSDYLQLRQEVAELMMPLLEDLTECDMFMSVDRKHGNTCDSLAEPCVNGGISFTILNKWCNDCHNWGGWYCRQCGKSL